MSDEKVFPTPKPAVIEPRLTPPIPGLLDYKKMKDMDDFCMKVMRGQVEKNKTDPILSRLEKEWATMDRFSKRELGPGDTKKK
jgi:hypothetical protein